MEIRWHWCIMSICYLLHTKIWFLGPKGQNLEIFKIFDKAHVWGSSALNMLPQVLDDVCEQRGDPDDDFEYWMASVPRRGAEIWAAKVFWRKTKKSRKCIFTIWAHPDAFICLKMVLRGTNSSHMKTYITVDHSGGIRLEIIHFEPKISRKYTRYEARIRKTQNGFFYTNCQGWHSVWRTCLYTK